MSTTSEEKAVRSLNKMGFIVEYVNPHGKTFPQRYRVWVDREKTTSIIVDNEGTPMCALTFDSIE